MVRCRMGSVSASWFGEFLSYLLTYSISYGVVRCQVGMSVCICSGVWSAGVKMYRWFGRSRTDTTDSYSLPLGLD